MIVDDWHTIEFMEGWRRQREYVDAILHDQAEDCLAFCEHPAVITLGKRTQMGSVLVDRHELASRGVAVIDVDRGGEATVHNQGQLVGYPMVLLSRHKEDLHWFLRTLEQCIIDALDVFHVKAHRVDGRTGVWVDGHRKICAIGIHCTRWVTYHGFALNVSNDLALFKSVIPCGIHDADVTSIALESSSDISLSAVKETVSHHFQKHFS
jgi:lipoate-protein ligase B